MQRFRDALKGPDLVHLRRILGEQEDPTFNGTKRHSRVNRLTMEDTYLADEAIPPFQALPQGDRERLISDVVWRVTCYVEGSLTKSASGLALEGGFRLRSALHDGRPVFCVERESDRV
ncbi:MAG: hypothetical protein HY293_15205 [Planctomycetes bacterium]|nr:hypothetical protein [Planctomycetota bacterium]